MHSSGRQVQQEVVEFVIIHVPGKLPIYKALLDFLRAQLPERFLALRALARGFFEMEFADEKGATVALKAPSMRWNGQVVQLSRWHPRFSASAPETSSYLSRIVKVQFPGLDAAFLPTSTLERIASTIGEVVMVEAADSYLKRPAGPIVTIQVSQILRLPSIVLLPCLAADAEPEETYEQKILYSGLPDQCKRCRKFGHLTKYCTLPSFERQTAQSNQEGRERMQEVDGVQEQPNRQEQRYGKETPEEGYNHKTQSRPRASKNVLASKILQTDSLGQNPRSEQDSVEKTREKTTQGQKKISISPEEPPLPRTER